MQVRAQHDAQHEINVLLLEAEDEANGALAELARAIDSPWPPSALQVDHLATELSEASESLRRAVALMRHDEHVVRARWWRRLLARRP